ncbi:hypothetical protein [Lysinibacillus sp. OF-1]|uniref:hypothetical protein n=1 Tax=Lysinibacillus sp. OF-1 TaxID=2972483 RepID=UPI00232DEE70|nr:hypothetical protein [Lysinibacillus sp. OF-1]WCH46417.1 hypothetical protein NV349_15120 [Lysinibacillus sp. OF-1]
MPVKDELRQRFIKMTENYQGNKIEEHSDIIEKVLRIDNEKALGLLNNLSDKFVKKATHD